MTATPPDWTVLSRLLREKTAGYAPGVATPAYAGYFSPDIPAILARLEDDLSYCVWQQRQARAITPRAAAGIYGCVLSPGMDGHPGMGLPDKDMRLQDLRRLDRLLVCHVLCQALRLQQAAYTDPYDHEAQQQRKYMTALADKLQRYAAKHKGLQAAGREQLTQSDPEQQDSLCCKLARSIGEELKVAFRIHKHLRDSREKGTAFALEQQHALSLHRLTDCATALRRPCEALLADMSIPVETGLPLQAAACLAALADRRSAACLRARLQHTASRHANLRTELLYGLGNVSAAVEDYCRVLSQPEHVSVESKDKGRFQQSLDWEKREAIWALGKQQALSQRILDVLAGYVRAGNLDIRLVLAWALGRIGARQRQASGGLDARVIVALMQMLGHGDRQLIAEVVYSLKRLGLPDFLHRLYLRDLALVPVLSLKPSKLGLYELSETVLHLCRVKQPVVMAVTGDSGTGKTFFCQALSQGFAALQAQDILYLMRDDPSHMRIYNPLIGLDGLKQAVDPQFYEDQALAAGPDAEQAMAAFAKAHAGKKLIILDGWMDQAHFYKLIARFHARGMLDILVNFRTSYSTRRLNLEQREGFLERVTSCLACREDRIVENTPFYQSPGLLIYNLDNSIESRLTRSEMIEVFSRKKVAHWEESIFIGPIRGLGQPLPARIQRDRWRYKGLKSESQQAFSLQTCSAPLSQATFSRELPESDAQPHLFQTLVLPEAHPEHIAFYKHGQLAFCAADGQIGIMIGTDDQLYYSRLDTMDCRSFCVAGDRLCRLDANGGVTVVSLQRQQCLRFPAKAGDPVCVCALDTYQLVTGCADGAIRVWDLTTGTCQVYQGHEKAVTAMTVNKGMLYTVGRDHSLCAWDFAGSRLGRLSFSSSRNVQGIAAMDNGLLVTAQTGKQGSTVDCLQADGTHHSHDCSALGELQAFHPYRDGRIFAGIQPAAAQQGRLYCLQADQEGLSALEFGRYSGNLAGCLTMGPRIITLSTASSGESRICLWGTRMYVHQERNKWRYMDPEKGRSPYYTMVI